MKFLFEEETGPAAGKVQLEVVKVKEPITLNNLLHPKQFGRLTFVSIKLNNSRYFYTGWTVEGVEGGRGYLTRGSYGETLYESQSYK